MLVGEVADDDEEKSRRKSVRGRRGACREG
jgi:hypothetical protein